MASDDFAIIIGLQNYPGLDDPANGQEPLTGPENDAKAFHDWVTSPSGGDITKPGNVDLILSSQHNPPFASVFDAKPVVSDVENAFKKLRLISENNGKSGEGLRVGRRLYIFMAGHGIAPDKYGEDKNEREAALLMANVERSNVSASYHILGAYTATWFCRNDCFDEVFLFMDCCRESALVQGGNTFLPAKGSADKAKRCYAFGTKWSRLSRERPMADEGGKVRGVFTKTLLLGLSGAAAEPNLADVTQGIITVASLKSYLYQNMKEFLGPEFQADSSLYEPDIDYWPKGEEGRDIVIASVPIPTFPFTIPVPAGAVGNLTVLYNGKNPPVAKVKIPSSPMDVLLQLPRGKYLAIVFINGDFLFKDFEIKGIEGLAGKGGEDV